ncbi:MAG: type III-B CRISPR module RAMP protein Cmr6 [Magnetococcus sp. DMHC-6]
MRTCWKELVSQHSPDHIGLAYDVWAIRDDTGKVPVEKRDDWLQRLTEIKISPDYQVGCYKRWFDALCQDGSRAERMTLSSRLLVGHGNPSATEVGLTVHHTWGVPVIPGSALKGLLSHYLEATYGLLPNPTNPINPVDPTLTDDIKQRALLQGVTWAENKILYGPGAIYRALFGAPEAEHDHDFPEESGATQGCVIFHDALYIPGLVKNNTPFAQDVLTVHQFQYYKNEGKSLPNDYDDPNPVGFISVRPGTQFLIALSGPPVWTKFAMDHLKEALQEWGVGGKSAAGYGLAKPDGWHVEIDPVLLAMRQDAAMVEFLRVG